jgi:mono/diheme cytochrome c family protein
MRRRVSSAALAAIVWLVASEAALAQSVEAQKGYGLAKQWCTSCHIVAPGQDGSDAAPPFEAIANRAETTSDGLRAWLANPHPPMPNLNLSRAEIDWIVAYLASLRRP